MWNSSLLLQKEDILLRFLYVFGFCNQAKSLALTLKILLVFICEAVTNQLQQSKGCYRVSYVLARICAKEEVFYKIMSNWRLKQKFNCKLVFWDSPGSGKILYTYNRLFLINRFLGVVTWNSLRGVFFFPCERFSSFVNK